MASGSAVSGADVNGFIQFRPRSGMFPRASPVQERDRDRLLSRGRKNEGVCARGARAEGMAIRSCAKFAPRIRCFCLGLGRASRADQARPQRRRKLGQVGLSEGVS